MGRVTTPATGLFDDGAVSIEEAATILSTSERSIRRWMERGVLGFTKTGRIRKLSRVELIRFLEKEYQPAKPS